MDAKETLSVLDEETERMVRLSASLLTLARESRSQTVLFDLAALVRDAALKHGAAYGGPETLSFTGDPVLLHQALLNLLGNTHKHAPGTAVRVKLEFSRQEVSLSVSDDGPGMPPEALAKATEPFYRAPGTSVPGSGLGLSVAAQIAAVHSGELTLTANQPTGLTVTVRLPVQVEAASVRETDSAKARPAK